MTQGDPLAMSLYALAMVPLIRKLHSTVPSASQVWFADDATAIGPARLVAPFGFCRPGLQIFSEFFKDFPDC